MSLKVRLFLPIAVLLIVASGCDVYSDYAASSSNENVPIKPCTPRPQHQCLASVNPLVANPPPHGYGPGAAGEVVTPDIAQQLFKTAGLSPGDAGKAITPDIAQQLFQAAGLSPGDIPGSNGRIFQRTVNLADIAGQQPGAANELSKDGAVEGYEQAFYTGAFGGVVTELAVFTTPDGAASYLTYVNNAALPMGQHFAGDNGLTATPQNYHSIDIVRVGDQSAGVEITGTWTVPVMNQQQSFTVDVGLARRGLVQYGVAVERTGSAGDAVSALNGILKTLDGKVAAAITSLGLNVPAGPQASYPAGWVLVAGPGGTTFGGAQGSLYTLQAGDDAYESLSPNTGVAAGEGYWAYFAGPVTVALAGQSTSNAAIQAPAGVWVMIGNPSATDTLGVHGADTVLVYDAAGGQYSQTTTLKPGQGAWALSLSGGTITIGP